MERDEDIRNIMTIIQNSSIEGNLVEISRQIAHDYLWNDETSVDCIPRLIQECNDRLQSLEQTRLFSIEEIGKGTINTPAMKKDESKKKVQSFFTHWTPKAIRGEK